MKKIISVIVTVAMLISCMAPTLATFAANEPALVITDASFDPAARDAKIATAVSVAHNPGFCFGVFYLYYDSTQLDVNEGAVTDLTGDGFTVKATYDVDVTSRNPGNALADAGVEVTDNLVCVAIEVAGDDNFTGFDIAAVEFDVIGDVAEGETLTVGIVPGVGRNDAPYDADDEDVILAAGVGTFTAAADANTPVYEDKAFENTTLYVDGVTVNKGVTTVEVCIGIDGTGDVIDQYGFNSMQFILVYDKDLTLVSSENGALVADLIDDDDGVDPSAVFNFADGIESEIAKECEKFGYDWANSDDNAVYAMFTTGSYDQIKDRGFIAHLTFEVPADKADTYAVQLVAPQLIASVYEPGSADAQPVDIPFAIDNGYVKVYVDVCEHENTTVTKADATCTSEGFLKEVCDDCGETLVDVTYDVLAHVPGDKIVVKQPTVDAEGAYKICCKNCPEVLETGSIPALKALVFTASEETAKYGDQVTVSIDVENNTGMFIAIFEVEYDESVLSLDSYNRGEVFDSEAEYIVNDYAPGVIRVYVESSAMYAAAIDGTVVELVFNVANDAALAGKESAIKLVAVEDGVVDADGTTLDTVFNSGNVTVASREAEIAIGEGKAPFGKEVLVPVTVDANPGMFIAILDVTFDSSKLFYIGFENGDVFAADNVIAKDYKDNAVRLYFEADGNADVTANGVLGYLKFIIADDADLYGEQIPVTISADAENMINYAGDTFEYVLVDGFVTVEDRAKIAVSDTAAKYGDEVAVDFALANNPGVFITIFNVKYDTTVLEFERFANNYGNHVLFTHTDVGEFRVYVEATEDADITGDTAIASFIFNVLADQQLVGTKGAIEVEVVETINYAGEDVDLTAKTGYVEVLDREKIVVEDTVAEEKHNVKVPVTVNNNTGFWAAGFEHNYDSEAFSFLGFEGVLLSEIEASAKDGVITVFGEAADIADITEDGVLYYLVFAALTETSEMDVTIAINEMINVNAEDVTTFATVGGKVTTVPCDHSENETYTEETKAPSVYEEGVMTYFCKYCDAVIKTETIAKLEALVVGEAEVGAGNIVRVPVTLSGNQQGVWALGLEVAYDAAAFEFVGAEGGLFAATNANASATNGVVTVFVDAPEMADITASGTAFFLVFKAAADAEGEYALTATLVADNTINVNGESVVYDVVNGSITVGEHVCVPADAVKENVIEATCVTEGSYDLVVYCSGCYAELSRETVELGFGDHKAADAVKENEIPATCKAEGSYDLVVYCSICQEEISRETFTTDKLAHTPADAVKENEVAATCKAEGSYDLVVYCSECGDEISRETFTTDKLAHVHGEPVEENKVDATYDAPGSYEIAVYCTECGEELSRETFEIPQLVREEFTLTVNGVSTTVKVGDVVEFTADAPVLEMVDDKQLCKVFANWVLESGNVEFDVESSKVSFVMPSEDVVISSETYYVGDLNGDGKVNNNDFIAIRKAILFEDMSGIVNFDVNGDGNAKVNNADFIALKAIILGVYTYPSYIG